MVLILWNYALTERIISISLGYESIQWNEISNNNNVILLTTYAVPALFLNMQFTCTNPFNPHHPVR